jgi:hypothetical protein
MRSIRFIPFELLSDNIDIFDEFDENELTEKDEDEHEDEEATLAWPICLAKQCFLSRENE